jgi:hypothetical protein
MSKNSRASKISKAPTKKEWGFPVAKMLSQSGLTDQEIEQKKRAGTPNSNSVRSPDNFKDESQVEGN